MFSSPSRHRPCTTSRTLHLLSSRKRPVFAFLHIPSLFCLLCPRLAPGRYNTRSLPGPGPDKNPPAIPTSLTHRVQHYWAHLHAFSIAIPRSPRPQVCVAISSAFYHFVVDARFLLSFPFLTIVLVGKRTAVHRMKLLSFHLPLLPPFIFVFLWHLFLRIVFSPSLLCLPRLHSPCRLQLHLSGTERRLQHATPPTPICNTALLLFHRLADLFSTTTIHFLSLCRPPLSLSFSR